MLLDLPGMRSPRLFDAADRAALHETAEEARLIYVVLTRARRRVWLSASQIPRRDAPWAPLCEALGIDTDHLPADGHLLQKLLRFERLAPTAEVTETASAAPQAAQQELTAALARHARYLERLPAVLRPRLAAPSALATTAGAVPAIMGPIF